ncbi:glycosyltransferase [Daejeonella oryzae]|uniref:glycosyltransferase n=1 Tax=Daejeonella oryzae TaxID=1122943 RepID=UPI000413259A|nr:glycosyltransferase [Daejeonella oryzae]
MLKVVHITTNIHGGAGKAALRLHECMLDKTEVNSWIISAESEISNSALNQLSVKTKHPNYFQRVVKRCGFPIRRSEKNIKLLERYRGNYEIFSFPTSDYELEKLDLINGADIINLHWVSNFVNYPTFFKAFKNKPIVWTLHDMNPFMGGFHYRNDFLNNSKIHKLDAALFETKRKAINQLKNLNIVAPSTWLTNEATKSGLFNSSTTFETIPYSLNTNIFKPKDKLVSKRKYLINPNLPCILIVAQNLSNHRKGFDLLLEALNQLKNKNFQLISIGNSILKFNDNITVFHLGTISDDDELATAYSAADLLIIPSREDNLPNVMLESLACGTPVLSFKTGGMKDWIIPDFNGLLASEGFNGIQSALEIFLTGSQYFDQKKISSFAHREFGPLRQFENYFKLYSSIM